MFIYSVVIIFVEGQYIVIVLSQLNLFSPIMALHL